MNEETKNRIVSLRQGGSSIRAIARQLAIPRYQVAKALAAQQRGRAEGEGVGGLPRAKKKRASCLDEYQPLLKGLLERYADITAVRAHEELKKSLLTRIRG